MYNPKKSYRNSVCLCKKFLKLQFIIFTLLNNIFFINVNTVLCEHQKLNTGRILITRSMKQTYKDTLTRNLIKQFRKTGQCTRYGKVYKGFEHRVNHCGCL